MLIALAFFLALILATQIAAWIWLRLPTPSDSIEWTKTRDGWQLPLYHYKGEGRVPVILCHGLGANRFNVDFDEALSLARFLRARGRNVFVLELRGVGRARFLRGRPPRWSFDDFVRGDVPAAIERVCALTGAAEIDWVGHSMGGMVMYAALPGEVKARVRSLVAIGSPSVFEAHAWLHPLLPVACFVSWIPPALGAFSIRLLAPFAGWVHVPGTKFFANPKNLDGRVARRALYNLFGPSVPGVMSQFSSFVHGGKLQSGDAANDYDADFAKIDKPILLFAGTADWLAPVASVRYFFDRVASTNKVFVECGVAHGFSSDYGHGDLLIGRAAPEEIFPRVEKFLTELDAS